MLYLTIRRGRDPATAQVVAATSDSHVVAAAVRALVERLSAGAFLPALLDEAGKTAVSGEGGNADVQQEE